MEEREALGMNPITLAFIGDAAYELMVREYVVAAGDKKARELHAEAVKLVSAEAQSAAVHRIEGLLTDAEADVLRRGRNATKVTVPKHASAGDYRLSTGFEAMFGYLFLTGRRERMEELFGIIVNAADE